MKSLIEMINESAVEKQIDFIRDEIANKADYDDPDMIPLKDITFSYNETTFEWDVYWVDKRLSKHYPSDRFDVKDYDFMVNNGMLDELDDKSQFAYIYFANKNASKIKKMLNTNYETYRRGPSGDGQVVKANVKSVKTYVMYMDKTVKSDNGTDVLPVIPIEVTLKYSNTTRGGYHDESWYIDMNGNLVYKDGDYFRVEQEGIYPDIKKDFDKFIDTVNKKLKK